MKCFFRLLTAFLLVGFFATDTSANIPKILLVKDLKPGTLAIGFSVFRGVEPQPFDVVLGEPIDKLGNRFILARVSGGPMDTPLEKIGGISGMSGSPIFIDCTDLDDCVNRGILVGALSYRIGTFIEGGMNCLLTPAEYMLGSRFGGYTAAAQFSNVMPDKIYVGGKEFVNLMILPKLDGSISQGVSDYGKCDESVKGELKPGSMVTVFLAKGSIPFGASGTVVWRDGSEVYIFGHPFMGTGMINYPFVHVAVADTIQTPNGAYKLAGCSLSTEGAMFVDGAFEVAGVIGETTPMIPFQVELHLNDKRAVLEEEIVPSPMAGDVIRQIPVAWAGQLLGDLNSLSIAYQVRIVVKSNPEIFIKNIAPAQVEENPFGKLFNKIDNMFQKLGSWGVSSYGIEKIDVHVDFINSPKIWTKKTAFLSQKEATPGETVFVNVVLEEFSSGAIQQMSFPIKVPDDFVSRLGVGASPSIDVLIQSGGKFSNKKNPIERTTTEDLIRQLNQAMNYRTDVLYIQQIMPRLKSEDEIDRVNAKASVKPAWKWTELEDGDLRQLPRNDKNEITLILSPELNGFLDFDATLNLAVQEKEEVVTPKKEIKKRRWFDFFNK